jgi:tRNA pseudouridine55 synthase
VSDADPEQIVALGDALSFLPEVRLDPDRARRVAHGGAIPGDGEHDAVVKLTDADGLVALAEPRPGGMLAPIVGLRSPPDH